MIKIEILTETEDVYDISVNDNHNFFANDILVHNCLEISLKSRQVCNLTSINFSSVVDDQDFKERAWAATLIGTLQATYTNFHYLSSKWQQNTEEDSLLGVSLTGIGDNKNYKNFNWKEITEYINNVNIEYSQKLGINPASRICAIKPEGTASASLGTSSGIHARFSKYYIRRVRYNKNEPLAQYLIKNIPEIVEDEFGNPNGIVVSIPQKSPDDSLFRNESPLETLERVKFFHDNWIKPTHHKGKNTHNVSCTINIKNNEWAKVADWMWNNRESYSGISVFPYDGGTYVQAPFEECTEEKYNELFKYLKDIDLTQIIEDVDSTDLKGEIACGGGSCEIV